jgi:hypothetical protein
MIVCLLKVTVVKLREVWHVRGHVWVCDVMWCLGEGLVRKCRWV